MLAAAGRLLVRQDGQPVVGRIVRQFRGPVVRAVQTIEDEDAAAEAARVEAPFFAGRRHGM